MKQAILLIVIVLVSAVFASCHKNCNNHGTCQSNTCECYEGWTGDDCSLQYLSLISGQTYTDSSVTSGDWVYFHTQVANSPLSMTYTIHDYLLGDCDMYVRYNQFPTKSHYDYKDDSWDNDFHISITEPQNGLWIAGIYNAVGCTFDLSFNIQQAPLCPNDCSGHGSCSDENQCICDQGYFGSDCSQQYEDLTDGSTHQGSASKWTWKYYYYDAVATGSAQSVPDFTIIVNQTAQTEDSDLYIKYEQVPTLWEYDARDATVVPNYALKMSSPQAGRYYIGVYGYTNVTWSIHVSTDAGGQPCSDLLCSMHGSCSNEQCHCYSSGFSGEHCEYMTTDLQEGQSVNGYAGSNLWNYYQVTANSASNMVISINQSSSHNGDCDLYVRANEYPDKFHYDYRDIGFDASFALVIENPLSSPWKIGVYGYRACEYYITMSLSAACPQANGRSCAGHGSCVNGRCSCNSGYAGLDCASPLTRVHSGTPVNGTIATNAWNYYKYTAPSVHSSITVELYEYQTVGYVQLYILQGAPPTLDEYLHSNVATDRALHNIYFTIDGTGDSNWYIGVYGSAFIGIQDSASYELLAYSPAI